MKVLRNRKVEYFNKNVFLKSKKVLFAIHSWQLEFSLKGTKQSKTIERLFQ